MDSFEIITIVCLVMVVLALLLHALEIDKLKDEIRDLKKGRHV